MSVLIIGFVVGLIVAVLEISMVRTYQKNQIILTAIGLHWVGVGMLMPFIDLGISIGLTGIIVGVILTVPFIVLDSGKSRNATIHTSIFAPVWGVVISYSVNFLASLPIFS
ncbi:MAG: hypothetical protein AAF639_29955 [Chloroflexota bacterium]